MSVALRVLRTTELLSASAPVAMAPWRSGLVVAAADLLAETAALWLVEDGRVVGASPLPLSQVDDLIADNDGLVISGSSATGQHRVLAGHSPASTGQAIEPETHGDLVREPRCILISDGVLVLWEEYLGQGTRLVAQHLRRDDRGWLLDRPTVRGPHRPFAGSARTVWGPGMLVDVRVNESGSVIAALLDDDLTVRAELKLADDRQHLDVIGGGRVVVAHSGQPGQPVVVQELDLERAKAAEPIAVPIEEDRATVGAVKLAAVDGGPLVALVTVETTLDDPETVDLGRGPELMHPRRRTTERCTTIDLSSGRLSNSILLEPSSHGGAALACASDRIYLAHGSSPLYLTELAVESGG